MIRTCLNSKCGREFKTVRPKKVYCSGICAQASWRGRNKNRIRMSTKSYKRETSTKPRGLGFLTTKILTPFELRIRVIDQCIAGKRGGYKWQ